MASASFKKYVVNLIKSNESDFRYRFYRGLLFDSNGRRHNLYSEIKTNPLLRGKLTNILCAKSLDQLNNVRFVFNNQMTDDEAATYACNLLSVCAKKVNRYLDLRSQYERVLMSSDYETAVAILNEIENELGISLWLCGQKLLLKERTLGLEGNKSELSNMFNSVSGNFILVPILYFYSCMAENGLSFENYQTELLRYVRDYEDSPIGRYLLGKLSFSNMYENKDIAFLLQIDSQCSLVDLYNSVERYLPAVIRKSLCNEGSFNLSMISDTIESNLFFNLRVLAEKSQETVTEYIESKKVIYDIIENYTEGKYEDAISSASAYIKENPCDLQVSILLCKSLICSGMAFPETLVGSYVESVYSIYSLSDTYRDAITNLKQIIKAHQGSVLSLKLYSLLKRKNIENGDSGSTFVSCMLDPVIHPNFLRYVDCETKAYRAIVSVLSQYCPSAIALSQTIKNGEFDSANISLVDDSKRKFLQASYLCDKGDFNAALEIANNITVAYSENYYLKERLQRVKLRSYIGNRDYVSAVRCIVATYFENEFMFERLAESGYCTLPRRIKDRTLSADINYVIFRYITSPSEYSKQITAYSNYIEANRFSNILDFASRVDRGISREQLFFLEKVCSVSLLKRDTTLSTLGTSAESARVQILQRLSAVFPSKKYNAEIQNLLTSETIKGNLQTINQSRIYADTAKIFSSHKEAWEEIYAKYMALKSVDAYYVDFDLKGQCNEDAETLGFRLTTHERVTQAIIVFKNMIDQIIEECLFSVQFGLETFLSSRIRHGYCKGQLTTFLDDLHLMVKKKDEESNEYILSEYWDNESHNMVVNQRIHEALSDFTRKIETKIAEVLNMWLRIKYKEGSVGCFDYSLLADFCVDIYYNGNYSSFAIFYNKIIAVFWDYTQSLLSTIRKKIETELTEYYLNALSELEGNLKKVSNAPDTIQEMLANCNLAKARVVQTMTQFAAAFTVNRSSYNDFTMDELTASCKMVASKSHSNSDAINWDVKADNSLLFSGKYFASFVDILNILLSNAIEHSGYDHASDLSLQVSIHEVQDSKDKEKTMIPNVFLFNKVMCMEVSNSLATDVDELLLEEKMRGIFTDLVENNSRKAKIQSEGGSGLYKLYNVATFNLDTLCSLLYDVTEGKITIWCYFVADPLISNKEAKNEDITD